MADTVWEEVSLPHTAAIEPLVMTGDQWTGVCWYRKVFKLNPRNRGSHVGLEIEAAMNDAVVWINGTRVARHQGGYTPFYLDLSSTVRFDGPNILLIRLDNRENAEIPPGKPLRELDFYYYSGVYRNVRLMVKNRLHFSNPVEPDTIQGGGLWFHTDSLGTEEAHLSAGLSVRNSDQITRKCKIEAILRDPYGTVAAAVNSEPVTIPSLSSRRVAMRFNVRQPQLWSPGSPSLYTLESRLTERGKLLETSVVKVGIRTISLSNSNGFTINGIPIKLRGTNRHQEYPYIGYALSDAAQYRDALKIRQAGFNMVRASHYPPSPAFLDACDELGILVMDAIPGWQFFGDSVFCENAYRNAREMCRRDRNHPSVVFWEASLNETNMPVWFIRKMNQIIHTELPYPDTYTCGWMDTLYDLFIPARQHSVPPDYWNKHSGTRPLFIAEYGSWEYYAQNAGFHQTEFRDLKPAERSSRQLRAYGERALLQQAFNFQEAHNDNLRGPAIGNANWVMFDYNRGYAPDIESSGIMDIFRLPKFTYWFYKSQSDDEPVCFIAHYNLPESPDYVRVFSNGDSTVLYRNGVLIAGQGPDRTASDTHLNHPPFTFRMKGYESGNLKAESFRDGKVWAEHSVTTPGPAANISLEADLANRPLTADGADVIFIHASITDLTGNILSGSDLPVRFILEGDGKLIGMNPIRSEAGIASILLRAGTHPGKLVIRAESEGLTSDTLTIYSVQ